MAAVAALRFLSGRYPSLVSLEVIVVALIMASPLAAHRNGYISRPYFLVDPLWSQNLDPVPVLLGLGALSAAVLVLLALGRRTRRASILDLILLLCLIAALYLALPEHVVRDFVPEPKGMPGLKGPPSKAPKGKGNGKDKGQEEDGMPVGKAPDQSPDEKQNPVAVVLLRDDYTPPLGYYYFRQTAFSQFNGQRLVADTTGNYDNDMFDSFPTEETSIKAPVIKNGPGFQTLRTYVALVESHPRPFAMVDVSKIAPANNPDPDKFVRAYEAESQVITAQIMSFLNCKAGSPDWKQEDWKHYTAFPSDPRYQELADKIVSELSPELREKPLAKAVAIKLYLDKTVTYTSRPITLWPPIRSPITFSRTRAVTAFSKPTPRLT
jgi:hypothetical protein